MIDSTIMSTAATVMHQAGLLVPSIAFDGTLHRVPTSDKPDAKNGAYIAHGDAPISIWWQNWHNGESDT